jgi:hypothetical protein
MTPINAMTIGEIRDRRLQASFHEAEIQLQAQ